jgi:hypothetical protein
MDTYQKRLGLLAPDKWLLARVGGVLPAATIRLIVAELAEHKRRYARATMLNEYATRVYAHDERGSFVQPAKLAMMRAALENPESFVNGEGL